MNIEGRKIVSVRPLTKEEYGLEEWYETAICLVLDDGTIIYPSSDEEGNNPGALFGVKDDESFMLG